MNPKKEKIVKAWAVITERGNLELYDHRLPICWLREIAIQEAKKWRSKVVPCTIHLPLNRKVGENKSQIK